jgi:tetratricopeptide (TPR) repeat protein
MMAFLKTTDLMTNMGGAEGVAAARQVTARAPDFAWGHSHLAFILATRGSGEEARIEAARAIALDPHDAEAYLALSVVTPRVHWREREGLLARGLSADPDLSFSNLFQARFLAQTGRLRDALPIAQRAVALRPLFPGGNATLGALLIHTGRVAEGRAVLEDAARTWPDNVLTRVVRFREALYFDDMDGALALIENPSARPGSMEQADIAMWRAVLAARKSRSPQAMQAVARRVRAAADSGALPSGAAKDALSLLGDADGALAEAARFYAGPNEFVEDTTYLFTGPTQTLRRDPRFMALAARLGLADYWRSTGRWPDFCSEAGLPYDCKAEAAKLSKPSIPDRQ